MTHLLSPSTSPASDLSPAMATDAYSNPKADHPSDDGLALALAACGECRKRKRKCNRALPSCSICLRVGRKCYYDNLDAGTVRLRRRREPAAKATTSPARNEDPVHAVQPLSRHNGNMDHLEATSTSNRPVGISLAPHSSSWLPALGGVDPFAHEQMRRPLLDITVRAEATQMLGGPEDVRDMILSFYDNVDEWMPVVLRRNLEAQLPRAGPRSNATPPASSFGVQHWDHVPADVLVLLLCMQLLGRRPTLKDTSMYSSQYAGTRALLNLLHSAGYFTLAVVQAGLLLCLYEAGHALYPQASITLSACARVSESLRVYKRWNGRNGDTHLEQMQIEEERRVWWGLIYLDRYINLCIGATSFAVKDPNLDEYLPMTDESWRREDMDPSALSTMMTPSHTRVGPLARACQLSHLISRTLRHVYEPSTDRVFHAQEADQLARTLNPFFTLLIEESFQAPEAYCTALGLCSTALLVFYEASPNAQSSRGAEAAVSAITAGGSISEHTARQETFSSHVATLATNLCGCAPDPTSAHLSPFVSHAVYQSAVVQRRLWEATGDATYKQRFDALRQALGVHAQRWKAAGKYLARVDTAETII